MEGVESWPIFAFPLLTQSEPSLWRPSPARGTRVLTAAGLWDAVAPCYMAQVLDCSHSFDLRAAHRLTGLEHLLVLGSHEQPWILGPLVQLDAMIWQHALALERKEASRRQWKVCPTDVHSRERERS